VSNPRKYFCTGCGTELLCEAEFCSVCATNPSRRERHCPDCGIKIPTTYDECPSCRENAATLTNAWREKDDDQLRSAADHLADYTEDVEQVIRVELQRRGLPEPGPTIRAVPRGGVSLFAGRIERLEFFVIWLLINLVAATLSFFIPRAVAILLAFILLVPPSVKRLHDLGQSAGFSVFLFVPVFNIVFLLALLLKKGQAHINQYG
jgi:hypothetical protein